MEILASIAGVILIGCLIWLGIKIITSNLFDEEDR